MRKCRALCRNFGRLNKRSSSKYLTENVLRRNSTPGSNQKQRGRPRFKKDTNDFSPRSRDLATKFVDHNQTEPPFVWVEADNFRFLGDHQTRLLQE